MAGQITAARQPAGEPCDCRSNAAGCQEDLGRLELRVAN